MSLSSSGKIIRARSADANHRVLSVEQPTDTPPAFRRRPCQPTADQPACPWRLDARTGEYPAQAYRLSAPTTYNMATRTFGCHQSTVQHPQTCAGFLLCGAGDNLTVRMWAARGTDLSQITSDIPLYASYRDMAIANGVDPNDSALAPCRGESTHWTGPEKR